MNRRHFVLLTGGLIIPGLTGGCASKPPLETVRETHQIDLDKKPPFLTEDLALAAARETLSEEGYDPNEWQPLPAGPSSTAPPAAGTPGTAPERCLIRLGPNQNFGRLVFRRGNQTRQYDLELRGKTVICRNWFGK